MTVAEILKNNGFAVEKSKNFSLIFLLIRDSNDSLFCVLNFPFVPMFSIEIRTSTVEINDESRGRPFQKAKVRKLYDISLLQCQCELFVAYANLFFPSLTAL